jgi:Zn-dependent metalloprotease
MERLFVVGFLIFISACGSSQTELMNDFGTIVNVSMEDRARQHLEKLPEYPRFEQSGLSLRLQSNKTDELGMTHLRFQQQFQNIPLKYAEVIVHLKQQEVYRVDGSLAEVVLDSAKPAVSASKAVESAAQFKQIRHPYEEDAQLKIVALRRTYDRLAWEVTIHKGLQRYIFWVDANTAAVIKEISGIQTSSSK